MLGEVLGEIFFTFLIRGVLAFLGAFWVALFLKIVLQKPESFVELFKLAPKKHWILTPMIGLAFIILTICLFFLLV